VWGSGSREGISAVDTQPLIQPEGPADPAAAPSSHDTEPVDAGFGLAGGPWWAFLLIGIGWLLISVIVLRFDIVSVAAVGVLLGVLFLAGTFNEFLTASVRPGWRWAHIVMGLLFAIGAGWAFVSPFGAFWALAAVFGLLLILRGALDVVTSISQRDRSDVWWLGLATGILMILLGFWVSQQRFPATAVLLLIWVGLFALLRGISEIVIAFEVRRRAPRHVNG
jgi:uncharacterized membrane protein HdeD (DUF308 family)